MNRSEPLVPRHPDGILRVILPGRISQPSQDPDSIESQQLDAEGWLKSRYDKPVQLIQLGEQISGWFADRATMLQAQAIIEAGECDLVLVGEIREVYRNPSFQWKFVYDCVDNDTRFIAIYDSVDTFDENWEVLMHVAAMRAGLEVPTTRRRIKSKATFSFARGGMVAKIKFGYKKLTREEALSGAYGPVGLRISKRSESTPTILEMKRRLLSHISAEAIADWLKADGIDPGPYAEQWSGQLVLELLTDPVLSGRRQFRCSVSKLIYKTGIYKARPNPKPPEAECYPELAHMTEAEQQEILDFLALRRGPHRAAQKCGPASPLWNQARSRSLWPGQSARCSACKTGWMYRFGEHLKCQNAVSGGSKSCWNHVLVNIMEVHAKVIPVVIRFLERNPRMRSLVSTVAWEQYQQDLRLSQRSTGGLDCQITDLEKKRDSLATAIAEGGELSSLLKLLKDVESRLTKLYAEREKHSQVRQQFGTYSSAQEIEQRFDEVVPKMAAKSREFAEWLRKLIPRFTIWPVQALDSGLVRPRAEITMSTAPWVSSHEEAIEETVAIDLFTPPLHIQCLAKVAAAKEKTPDASLRQLEVQTGINYMTIKRAIGYMKLMQEAGTRDPYRVLIGPPISASRWRHRQQKEQKLVDAESSENDAATDA